jgi:hypothetical protein
MYPLYVRGTEGDTMKRELFELMFAWGWVVTLLALLAFTVYFGVVRGI